MIDIQNATLAGGVAMVTKYSFWENKILLNFIKIRGRAGGVTIE